MTNLKLNMSASASWVDSLDVPRPQSSSWLIRQTHWWILVIVVTFICNSAFAADIPSLVRKTKPAVVQILCYNQDDQLVTTGTGFFISPDGKLLTNCHVLEGNAYSIVAKAITGQRYWRQSVFTDFQRIYSLRSA